MSWPVGLVEVDLCQESSSGSLGGTALLGLSDGQYLIGLLEVVDNLLPTLVVGVLGVRHVVIVVLGHVGLVDKGNLLEQALQLEVSIGTQEQHLAGTLADGGIVLVSLSQHIERQGNTRQIVVELAPDGSEVPILGQEAIAALQIVEHIAVREACTSDIGIVRAGVVVPKRERCVHILDGQQSCIGRNQHIVNVFRVFHLILCQSGLRHLIFKKAVAGSKTTDSADDI